MIARSIWGFVMLVCLGLTQVLAGGGSPASLSVLQPKQAPVLAVKNEVPNPALVVIADPTDAYYSLAQEISRTESAPLVSTLAQALNLSPWAVVWVAEPQQFTDRALAEAGQVLLAAKERPALGVISGVSVEAAAQLWQRQERLRPSTANAPTRLAGVNAVYPSAGFTEGRIVRYAPLSSAQPLSLPALVSTLQQVDYLTFTGHGSARSWMLDPQTDLRAEHLPSLPPVLIGTASCQTFRLGQEGSIALAFARQGAAGYAGFTFSPNEGYLIGEFSELPFRYTYPEFPIGLMVQAQVSGTLQGFALFPTYFWLGDPRIAMQAAPPYRVTEDRQQGNERWLRLEGVPAGLVPVKIPDGSDYAWLEVPGVGAIRDGEIFFNAHLQSTTLNGDRYLVFVSPAAGEYTLHLKEQSSVIWTLGDTLGDAFDYAFLFLPQGGGDALVMGLGGLAFTLLLLGHWRKEKKQRRSVQSSWGLLPWASGLSLLFTGLLCLLAWLRLPAASSSTKPLGLYPLNFGGLALLWAAALFWAWTSPSRRAQVGARLVAVLGLSFPLLIQLALIVGFNELAARPALGVGIYNLHSILALLVLIVIFIFMFEICLQTKRWVIQTGGFQDG